jgi:predicted outer membrane lipoprotein
MVPGRLAFIILAIWLSRIFVLRLKGDHDFSWVSIILGNVLAIVFGIMARVIYYSYV